MQLLQALKDAGCAYIRFGFESANQTTLDVLERKIRYDRMVAFIENAATVGIRVRPSIMIGIPGESQDDVKRTAAELRRLPLTGPVAAWAFTPIPGTKAYENRNEYNIEIHSRDFARYTPHASIISTPQMSRAEIDLLLLQIQLEFGVQRNLCLPLDKLLAEQVIVPGFEDGTQVSRCHDYLHGVSNSEGSIAPVPPISTLERGDRVIVAHQGSVFELNHEAAFVWLATDRPYSMEEVSARYDERFSENKQESASRVRSIALKLTVLGLLRTDAVPTVPTPSGLVRSIGDIWFGEADNDIRYLAGC
jgi:hypothetical protein